MSEINEPVMRLMREQRALVIMKGFLHYQISRFTLNLIQEKLDICQGSLIDRGVFVKDYWRIFVRFKGDTIYGVWVKTPNINEIRLDISIGPTSEIPE